jgi:hypothetical protein
MNRVVEKRLGLFAYWLIDLLYRKSELRTTNGKREYGGTHRWETKQLNITITPKEQKQ